MGMRKAILTGHSRGLGAALADQLRTRFVPVLGISSAQVDLADAGAIRRWLDGGELARFVAGADTAYLVNNAGLLQPIGPLETQDVDAVLRAVTVNVGAPLALSSAFVKATEHASDRRIMHISSGAGRKAYAGWDVYCATKAALDHHARCVALERTRGLRISSVAPGVIDTDMQAEIRASSDTNFPQRERFVGFHQRGELPDPRDVATRLVDFLLGDDFGRDPVADLSLKSASPPQSPS
jgi:NAD(P)-dependent dehydrogenase (short-subunit alcohol dehydrogenase family)